MTGQIEPSVICNLASIGLALAGCDHPKHVFLGRAGEDPPINCTMDGAI